MHRTIAENEIRPLGMAAPERRVPFIERNEIREEVPSRWRREKGVERHASETNRFAIHPRPLLSAPKGICQAHWEVRWRTQDGAVLRPVGIEAGALPEQ